MNGFVFVDSFFILFEEICESDLVRYYHLDFMCPGVLKRGFFLWFEFCPAY